MVGLRIRLMLFPIPLLRKKNNCNPHHNRWDGNIRLRWKQLTEWHELNISSEYTKQLDRKQYNLRKRENVPSWRVSLGKILPSPMRHLPKKLCRKIFADLFNNSIFADVAKMKRKDYVIVTSFNQWKPVFMSRDRFVFIFSEWAEEEANTKQKNMQQTSRKIHANTYDIDLVKFFQLLLINWWSWMKEMERVFVKLFMRNFLHNLILKIWIT